MKINQVTIELSNKGRWFVIADTESGLCHDDFDYLAQAQQFSRTFYGIEAKVVA